MTLEESMMSGSILAKRVEAISVAAGNRSDIVTLARQMVTIEYRLAKLSEVIDDILSILDADNA